MFDSPADSAIWRTTWLVKVVDISPEGLSAHLRVIRSQKSFSHHHPPLRALALLIHHRPAGLRGGGQFGVGEVEER